MFYSPHTLPSRLPSTAFDAPTCYFGSSGTHFVVLFKASLVVLSVLPEVVLQQNTRARWIIMELGGPSEVSLGTFWEEAKGRAKESTLLAKLKHRVD